MDDEINDCGNLWGFYYTGMKQKTRSKVKAHLLSLPQVRSKSSQTAERGLIFLATKGLCVTFQSFSEPILSSLFQHPRYLVLPLALNRLRDAEECLPVIALPAHSTILSLSSFRTPSCAAAHSVSATSIAHTEEPVAFPATLTLPLVIVLSPQLSGHCRERTRNSCSCESHSWITYPSRYSRMMVLSLRARGGVYVFNLSPGTDLLRLRDGVSCEGRMSRSGRG